MRWEWRSDMSAWDDYPEDYRTSQVQSILSAVRAGESAAVIGLSGSGKSNLLGYLAHRWGKAGARPRLVLVDCNRLADVSAAGSFSAWCALPWEIKAPAADELGRPGSGIGSPVGRIYPPWGCCWTASMPWQSTQISQSTAIYAPCATPTNMSWRMSSPPAAPWTHTTSWQSCSSPIPSGLAR